MRVATVLVRIDDSRHTNPDGQQFDGLHVHTYREGSDDKWAQQLDPQLFTDPSDIERLFREFCNYCNIDHRRVTIQVGML